MKGVGILLGGGVLATALYIMYNSGQNLQNLDVKVSNIDLVKSKTNWNQTTLKLTVSVYNPNSSPVEFKSFSGNIKYQGKNIANIDPLTNVSRLFASRQTSTLPLTVSIPNDRLATSFLTVINQMLDKSTKPVVVDFTGALKAEKMTIPINQTINLTQIIKA